MDWSELQSRMIRWRRDLHQIPELGNDLPQTSAYVQGVLREQGITFKTLLAGNAVVGLIEGSAPGAASGKTIALRADMDALPVREETGLPFASTNGCMHACGHDGHTAMLLGAAVYLNRHRELLKGKVKLFFQPGEEYPGGAEPMIREGCMADPKVDAVFGFHEGQISPQVPEGAIAFREGPLMAAMDRLLIKVHGKGGHGAYPHLAIDPVPLACELVLALQTLVSRETNPVEPVVLSITRIAGGFNQNVIPDTVELEGTVRTLRPETRERLRERIRQVAEALAASRGASVEVLHEFNYPALINDKKLTALAKAACLKLTEYVIDLPEPVMGGEDFAYYGQVAPATYAFMGNPGQVDGRFHGHHSPRFDVDESFFELGARLHAQVAIDFLNDAD